MAWDPGEDGSVPSVQDSLRAGFSPHRTPHGTTEFIDWHSLSSPLLSSLLCLCYSKVGLVFSSLPPSLGSFSCPLNTQVMTTEGLTYREHGAKLEVDKPKEELGQEHSRAALRAVIEVQEIDVRSFDGSEAARG